MGRAPLVVGNWKMNGSLTPNADLLGGVVGGVEGETCDVGVCVPFLYLGQTQSILQGSVVKWGAQNVSEHAGGAYTGEISASMLTDFGVSYAIVGHSERRSLYGESSELVGLKAKALLSADIQPIICVGETLEEREAGSTFEIVGAQLEAAIECVGVAGIGRSVLAYEPVWAIGTGLTAKPDEAQAVHRFLRERVERKDSSVAESLRILYGGSVKPDNAESLFGQKDIDGGLIGGASLNPEDFLAICRAASAAVN